MVGHGELWCARLFSLTVEQRGVSCAFMDTREVLVVTSPDGKAVDVEYAESDAKLDAWAQKHGVPQVRFPETHSRQTPTWEGDEPPLCQSLFS